MENEFTTAADALAKIPPGAEFQVRRSSGGRPTEVSPLEPGKKYWDAISFDTALRMGLIDGQAKYHLTPIISGKKSSQRITLNLDVENTNVAVNGGQGQPSLPVDDGSLAAGPMPLSTSPHLQEVVVVGMFDRMSEDRQDLKDARAQVSELTAQVLELKLKVQRLELEAEFAGKMNEQKDGGNQLLGQIMNSPALPVFLNMVGQPKLAEVARHHVSGSSNS